VPHVCALNPRSSLSAGARTIPTRSWCAEKSWRLKDDGLLPWASTGWADAWARIAFAERLGWLGALPN
jgi:hypothetical protein